MTGQDGRCVPVARVRVKSETTRTAAERNGSAPDLDDLLVKTSRTFALSIPLLPDPTREEVTIAYLLFRIADTFEDATAWSVERRREALDRLGRLVGQADEDGAEGLAASWLSPAPIQHDGYLELLAETPGVLRALADLRPKAQAVLREHLGRTMRGMEGYVERSAGADLRLSNLDELKAYCHVVAGIVGEMLTELFLLGRPELASAGSYLRERAGLFGEGLQLTNILKDADGDAAEGRLYVPASVGRQRVFQEARQDLDRADEYVRALQQAGAPRGIVAFCALPTLLARATLDCVADKGPGAKISRARVLKIVESMNDALDRGDAVI